LILDLEDFVKRERPLWDELARRLDELEAEPSWRLDLDQARRLHYLYERTAAALAQISTFSAARELQQYVESLVARAYAAINSVDRPRRRFRPLHWFFRTFPRTFRRHGRAFALSAAVLLAGFLFGAGAVGFDPSNKEVLLPFEHLQMTPAQRVQREESHRDRLGAGKTPFASMLMANNIRVSVLTLALGMTWGIGTIVLLFYNGVILGGVAVDFIVGGQTPFLLGWLLPHGSIEIPAILIAGQAGLVLASAMIGRGERAPFWRRFRDSLPSVVTLIFGVAILLVWAGIVEAFFSQYHQPVLPYWLKIVFGCAELTLLGLFLGLSGRGQKPEEAGEA
jgi:uncharacterized membrane protein SpoIIM required for sporulation